MTTHRGAATDAPPYVKGEEKPILTPTPSVPTSSPLPSQGTSKGKVLPPIAVPCVERSTEEGAAAMSVINHHIQVNRLSPPEWILESTSKTNVPETKAICRFGGVTYECTGRLSKQAIKRTIAVYIQGHLAPDSNGPSDSTGLKPYAQHALSVYCQKRGISHPQYEITTASTSTQHGSPLFFATIEVNGQIFRSPEAYPAKAMAKEAVAEAAMLHLAPVAAAGARKARESQSAHAPPRPRPAPSSSAPTSAAGADASHFPPPPFTAAPSQEDAYMSGATAPASSASAASAFAWAAGPPKSPFTNPAVQRLMQLCRERSAAVPTIVLNFGEDNSCRCYIRVNGFQADSSVQPTMDEAVTKAADVFYDHVARQPRLPYTEPPRVEYNSDVENNGILSYGMLLKQYCLLLELPPPHSFMYHGQGGWTGSVRVCDREFRSTRPHALPQNALEDAQGDAWKFLVNRGRAS
ncbi:hypothetical protein CXG81DRAFT_19484 [Caulochytrium protostelioides]|uniref:DRBM domain-containing protein n=1 Tax=Caulochytrium protostelioides TaxID=1555241 RepID=A0A4P9X621_9FUNG|nr:hypothetical protein CXG81DRAFT_19484 [Caulochytrium protostelioides]|eukprot:RKP00605.1 hypothetical protein CXG81DRAFT_19484 [Caulochytrium protostelioides]